MTPKEKAEWLVVKFFILPDEVDAVGRLKGSELKQLAKQCAIICVEQIINELNDVLEITGSSYVREEIKHWNEVIEHLKRS